MGPPEGLPQSTMPARVRPNDMLISCKRLVKPYGPLSPLGASRGRSAAPPAFVGCISGLGSPPARWSAQRSEVRLQHQLSLRVIGAAAFNK
jgi:hypothetical protein